MMRSRTPIAALAVALPLLLGRAGPAAAQSGLEPTPVPITLAEAEARALEGNGDLQAAAARRDAAAAGARGAGAFMWPGVQATAGALRTDDPVGVFGTKLRQERFTEMDFALPALNSPDPVSDFTAGVGAEWQLASPVRWAERAAARSGAEAAEFGHERTEEAVRFQTRILYLRAVQAQGGLEAAEAALAAAEATAVRVARRVDEGMGTEADRLQAQAAEAQARAVVGFARAAVRDASEVLGAHLGWDPGRVPMPSERDPALADRTAEADAVREIATGLAARADLRASAAGVEAARAQARAAGARQLPALSAFGQVGTHAPGITDDRASNWTVGVQVSLPVFTGFGLAAGRDMAQAEARAADAEHGARLLRAAVEVTTARRGVTAAREAFDAVAAAQAAATEAARLLRRRYEEGMTTLADLLQAEARAAELDAALVEARTGVLMALARLDFALGDAR